MKIYLLLVLLIVFLSPAFIGCIRAAPATVQRENFKVNNFTGLVFNPIENIWKLNSNKTKINYFCSAKLI